MIVRIVPCLALLGQEPLLLPIIQEVYCALQRTYIFFAAENAEVLLSKHSLWALAAINSALQLCSQDAACNEISRNVDIVATQKDELTWAVKIR